MGRKRKNGEGTVCLRKDGRWEGRVVVGYDDKGLPKTKNILAKTKTECVQKLNELFLLKFATGLRLGELMALQWEDLNLATGELRINKQASIVGSELVISEPKTKAAIRTLILPPQVAKVMKDYKTKVDSQWLFPSPKKENLPLRPSVVHQRLHRILDHAGCERVRFHNLRHTFATNALAHGMDVKTLSTILGYVSSTTTLNTYSHVTDEMRKRAAVKIDQGIVKAAPNSKKETTPKDRTMTTFQARKRWSRKAG